MTNNEKKAHDISKNSNFIQKGLPGDVIKELMKLVKPKKIGTMWFSERNGRATAHETELDCLKYFDPLKGKR